MNTAIRLTPALLLAALVACGGVRAVGGDPNESVSQGASPPAGIPENYIECTNDVDGYRLWYPDDWSTASTDPANTCRWFDRDPLELDEGSEPPPLDLEVVAEEASFDALKKRLGKRVGEELLTRSSVEIEGARAIRYETRATGEGQYPVDSRTFGILLEVEGRAFRVMTQLILPDQPPYEENQVVVEEVAKTIRVLDRGGSSPTGSPGSS